MMDPKNYCHSSEEQQQQQGKRALHLQHLSFLEEQKETLRKGHSDYLSAHPELQTLMRAWTGALMREQPRNIFPFLRQYFASRLDIRKGVGPSCLISGPAPLVVVSARDVSDLLESTFPETFEKPIATLTRPPRSGEEPGVNSFFATVDDLRNDESRYYEVGDEGTPGALAATSLESIARIRALGKIPFLNLSLERAAKARQCPFIRPPPYCLLIADKDNEEEDSLFDVVLHSDDTLLETKFIQAVADFYLLSQPQHEGKK